MEDRIDRKSEAARRRHKEAWQLAERCGDVSFKFASWLIAIGVFAYAARKTGVSTVLYAQIALNIVFVLAALSFILHLMARDAREVPFLREWPAAAKVADFILAIAMIFVVSSPLLLLDRILDALVNSR